jgi:hypothetical protein
MEALQQQQHAQMSSFLIFLLAVTCVGVVGNAISFVIFAFSKLK